ncbi:MAG: radical SAM protein [Chitinivibrionales bacterium]|nr:radical SAM protein [Chitinivibrionales bacterium]MBD3356649.1 radical SAM protein [Chitinivibrionales bacterium]
MITARTTGTDRGTSASYQYLFGPVNSRRLGISLGVDPVPFKTCTLNCAYCECGATTRETLERREYVPARSLISELDRFLENRPHLDYITFAGSGEPTLNSAMGTVVRHLKEHYPHYRTALLTNSTLFGLPEVRQDASLFNLVLPSLDAVSEKAFSRLNRPARGLGAHDIVEGLLAFAREYTGTMWVEIFIAPGINDTDAEISLLKDVLKTIAPARVQLNSLDRPGACPSIKPATPQLLADIGTRLYPLPVEIVSRAQPPTLTEAAATDLEGKILPLLKRRPCTLEDLAVSCRCEIRQLRSVLKHLLKQGRIQETELSGKTFYRC